MMETSQSETRRKWRERRQRRNVKKKVASTLGTKMAAPARNEDSEHTQQDHDFSEHSEHTQHHESSEHHGNRNRRRIIDTVRLKGPHDDEARYWELFSDLLLVAAASSIAENLEEEADFKGWIEFAILYFITANGWLLYSHHYNARFDDSSLVHCLILFFYYLGMAGSIVNADFEAYKPFSYAATFQRIAFIALMLMVARSIPKAKEFAGWIIGFTFVACLLFVAAALLPEEYVIVFWSLAAAWEFFIEVGMVSSLKGEKLIKINIDHTNERLGVLVLIMLGETVITSTITYKSYATEAEEEMDATEYYTVMTLSFLLMFMYILLFFNQQPAPKDHGMRRSLFSGICLMLLNKLLGLVLLTIGACMKLCVSAVIEGDDLTPFVSNAFRMSVGMSLVLLLAMRICHYGGKLPRPTDPPHVRRLFFVWWGIFALGCFVPFVTPASSSPTIELAWPSGLAFVLCLIESWFTHVLEEHLPSEESAPLHASSSTPTYDTIQ